MYRISVYVNDDGGDLALFLTELIDIKGLFGVYTYPATARFVSKAVSTSMSPKVVKIEMYVAEPSEVRDKIMTSGLTMASRTMVEKINDIY